MNDVFYYTGLIIWVLCAFYGVCRIGCEIIYNSLKYAGMIKNLGQFWLWQRANKEKQSDQD